MIDDMLKRSVDTFYNDFQPKANEEKEEHRFPVEGYGDEENMWELLVNVRDKKSRKEAKAQYFQPVKINSKYAFQVKDRQFKIKKYSMPQPPIPAAEANTDNHEAAFIQ